MDDGGQRPLGRLETLGAWLRIWTPRRDAVVPPVPKRGLALGAAAVVLAALGGIALLGPAIEEGKRTHEEQERAARAGFEAAKQRRLRSEGRTKSARVRRPPGGDTVGVRRELVAAVERSITRDARARARRGRLDGPVLGTSCVIEPPSQRIRERDLRVAAEVYDCLAVTRRDPEGRFEVGDPFKATVRYRDFAYTWRRVCLPPGEGAARLEC